MDEKDSYTRNIVNVLDGVNLDLVEGLKSIQDKFYNNAGSGLPVKPGPFVTSTDKWTQLAIKKLLTKGVKEDYDYVSFAPGDIHYERWNEEGLITFYDYIIPKNAEKVLKQIDKDAITYISRTDLGLDDDSLEGGKVINKLL